MRDTLVAQFHTRNPSEVTQDVYDTEYAVGLAAMANYMMSFV